MPRHVGARLAVPLLTVIVLVPLALLVRGAAADDGCIPTPTGIECDYRGTTSSTSLVGGALPPLRYLAVVDGRCWYWSRHPPGLDSWDPANDQAIIFTRFALPECAGPEPADPIVVTEVRAWEVFRAFPLETPRFRLSPSVGITNLPSRLHLEGTRRFRHTETLPDGRVLEVEAWVEAVWVEWGDGAPGTPAPPSTAIGDPGAIRHTYVLKTCPPAYRTTHLDGPKCHPQLEAYPVTVSLRWRGRYRAGGAWLGLGVIERAATRVYDVDEVLGILIAP